MGTTAPLACWSAWPVICGLNSDMCEGELLAMLWSYVSESVVEQVNWTGTVLCEALLKLDYSDCPVIGGLAKSEILDFWLWHIPLLGLQEEYFIKLIRLPVLLISVELLWINLCLSTRTKPVVIYLLCFLQIFKVIYKEWIVHSS